MNIRGQDLWRSQRSPEIFLTNILSRPSVTNLITGQRELCEILLEARSKIGSLAIISFFVRPGIPRNEHFAWDIRTSCGRTQTKDRVCKHLDLVERPANCRPDHRSRIVDINTFTYPKGTTTPSGINEIAAYLVLFNTFTQQICILSWSQRQKGGAKTGTKRCLWASNTRFCPCKFTGIARQKIIHSLLCSEFRNRW